MERPKRTDTEDDILEMQRKFLSLKSKNESVFQPAAQVIKIEKQKKQSLFAQKRKTHELIEDLNYPEPPLKTPALGEIVENITPPVTSNSCILGDIIEKFSHTPMKVEECNERALAAFPKVEKLDFYELPKVTGKSLFALSMEMKNKIKIDNSEQQKMPEYKVVKEKFGDKSVIVKDEKTANSVHEENVTLLNQMTEEEIIQERANLLKCIDLKVLDFIKSQKNKLTPDTKACVEVVKNVIENKSKKVHFKSGDKDENISDSISKIIPFTPLEKKNELDIITLEKMDVFEISTVSGILHSSESENWINFNIIEKEKFEWMKEIPDIHAKMKPGEPFEARFDWKGILLPYVDEDQTKDDRDLYMHGEEVFRPGYTLQELFRLARSNIVQQRCSAFGAIYGILSIYNQGFYDNVLEVPITKIFFLLRYGMDENTLSQLEIVLKGISALFYNDTDETILDFIFETSEGFLQPLIESNKNNEIDDDIVENIEKPLKNLKLSKIPFSAKLDDKDKYSKALMTDFELAENNLIDCLLRTNIISRIHYILKTIKPENSTVISCFKILIRLARTNKDIAKTIVSHEDLINILIESFLPGLQKIDLQANPTYYNYPQYLVLKLFRIIMSQHLSLCIKLLSMNLLDIIKSYLYSREDIMGLIIKVQIECFRIIRILMHIKPDFVFYKSLLPAFRYMLEWHYNHVIYESGGPFLIRQHASALFNAITSGPCHEAKSNLTEVITMCCSKWFYSAKQSGIKEFSQSNLLSSCINFANWYIECDMTGFEEFIEKYLKPFIFSNVFIEFVKNLEYSSIVLKYESKDRRNIHPSLPNIGTVLLNSNGPQLIVSQSYPIYFLSNLFKLTQTLVQKRNNSLMLCLMQVDTIEILVNYLKKISGKVNKTLATNFITKSEIKLIFKLICFEGFHEYLSDTELLQASFNLIGCMSSEHIQEIEIIFKRIIFNKKYLSFEENVLENWKQIYLETFIYPHRVIISPTEISLCLPCFPEPILPSDWPYMLLKSLLNKYLQQASKEIVERETEFSEGEVIQITLTFTNILERNGLEITSPTEKLMYLMIAFMGTDAVFLESDMNKLLRDHIDYFFKTNVNSTFNFYGTFEGKSKFENLYVLFLDHFQAASYGDSLFSSLVMVPLAQKYDSKWRKMVWSEHASVLRFLNCDENQLLGSLESYLKPDETEISLIKNYASALNSNILRENTIPYKIAVHHLNQHKNKNNSVKKH